MQKRVQDSQWQSLTRSNTSCKPHIILYFIYIIYNHRGGPVSYFYDKFDMMYGENKIETGKDRQSVVQWFNIITKIYYGSCQENNNLSITFPCRTERNENTHPAVVLYGFSTGVSRCNTPNYILLYSTHTEDMKFIISKKVFCRGK